MSTSTVGITGVLKGQNVKIRRDLKDMSFLYRSLIALFILLFVLSIYLWSRLMVINIGYDISSLNSEYYELKESRKRLTLELRRLKSPERIEKIARTELGLVYPTGRQVQRIK